MWRIRLANFRLTGNERSGHGIEARRVNEIFIEGVTVSNHGADGIHLHYCYEDPRICDSLITYNKKVGLNAVGSHDIVVASNQFEENQDAIRCADGFNLCMTGNNFSDSYVGDEKVTRAPEDRAAAGLTLDGATDVAVVGNLFSSLRPKAVTMEGTPASRILFADNVLVDTLADSGKAGRSIIEGNLGD